jgi:hypothetical protein
VPEFFFANFAGTSQRGTYWGGNPIKLHSEYLGLSVIALAVLGAANRARRRLVLALGGIGILFLLVGLGSATPFYRLWWGVMPFMKQVRAPGMALYVVCLVVAVYAALGAEAAEQGGAGRWGRVWAGVGAAVMLLGLAGVLGGVARSLAENVQLTLGRGVVPAAVNGQGAIRAGALGGGLALALLGGVAWAVGRGRIPPWALVGIPIIVGGDLWLNARAFWEYSERPQDGLYGGDALIQELQRAEQPARVLDLSVEAPVVPVPPGLPVYPGAALMAFHLPQLLGHHAMQPDAFNELLGGRNVWTYLLVSRRLWDLFAVRYVLVPSGIDLGVNVPAYENLTADYDTVRTGVTTSDGAVADLLIRRDPAPYARLVPAAIKVPDDQAIPTVADPRSRLDFDRLLLLPEDSPLEPGPIDSMPAPLGARVNVDEWEPGRMRLTIDPAAPSAAYVTVAENFSPGWKATVDGASAAVTRGNVALITVAVPPGARQVELRYDAPGYATGRLVTWVSLVLAAAACFGPAIGRRRRA